VVAHRLGATYPPALRAASSPAYLVLLRVEIARFTRCGALAPHRVAARSRLAPWPGGLRHPATGLHRLLAEHPAREPRHRLVSVAL